MNRGLGVKLLRPGADRPTALRAEGAGENHWIAALAAEIYRGNDSIGRESIPTPDRGIMTNHATASSIT